MKKISFWIVIFICMADAALAVTQEGGLFYLPEDTTTQHKDSTCLLYTSDAADE